MDWTNAYTAKYYIALIDAYTWREIGTMDITGGSIDREEGDLMESADLDMREIPENGEAWIRVYLDTNQNDKTEHTALFTGLTSIPKRSLTGRRAKYSVECYSVLKPAADVLLERGYYVPTGVNAAMLAANLLKVSPAPVTYAENSPVLVSSIVAEDGETNLTMAEKIVAAIGWQIRLNGSGEITIKPKNTDSVYTFDALENDIVELDITDELDWFSCPNVLRVISGDVTAIARDDDPDSRLSTVNRGREIWAEESDVTLSDNESVAAYAIRRLKELQSPSRKISYSRRFVPDVYVGDVVTHRYTTRTEDGKLVDISGDYTVTSQSIELGYSARTSEEATAV